jgi:PAS domain S-box-containing protein
MVPYPCRRDIATGCASFKRIANNRRARGRGLTERECGLSDDSSQCGRATASPVRRIFSRLCSRRDPADRRFVGGVFAAVPGRFHGPGLLLAAFLATVGRMPAETASPSGAGTVGAGISQTRLIQIAGVPAAAAMALLVVVVRQRRALKRAATLRERIIRESNMERRQTRLAASAEDFIATVDSAGRILAINDAGRQLTGAGTEGRPLADCFHATDRALFGQAFQQALAGTPPVPFEVRHPGADGGSVFEVVVRASTGSDSPEIHCVARDITSRKRIELAAREAILRQRAHFENTPLGVIEWNARFEVVAWNPAAERIFGWTASEALGRTADFITPVSGRRVLDRMWDSVIRRQYDQQVAANITNGGRSIQCLWYHTPLLSPEGLVAGVTSLVRDVTRERETALQLEETEQRQRLVLSALAEGVLVVDAGALVRSANESAERITGYPASEMTGLRIFEWAGGFLDDEGREIPWARTPLATVLLDDANSCSWRMGLVREDGRKVWLSGYVRRFPESSQSWAGARVVSFTDVTAERDSNERRQLLEAQLLQSQKMEALGTLAGGVAHDFNNVLAMILGNAELVRADLVPGTEPHERIGDIATAARRGAEVVARILAFSRPQAASRTPVRLSSVVDDVLRLVRVSLPHDLEIITRFDEDEPAISGDAAQLRQMILNLVTNAVQAMETPGPGVLTVEVRRAAPRIGEVLLLGSCPRGDSVCLSVADTGPGMPPEVRRRIFEPFFTTKPPGKGTGLGLAVVHGILQAHDGAVRVDSRPGEGTRFDLFFPAVAQAAVEPAAVGGDEDTPAGRAEHVLLVDDEPGVLSFTRSALTRLGYQVSAFVDPQAALEEFRRRPGRFDLVLTDLSMPFLTGAELACEIRRLDGVVPLLLASGYAASDELDEDDRRHFTAVLAKPFRIAELATLIRNTLDASKAASEMPAQDI